MASLEYSVYTQKKPDLKNVIDTKLPWEYQNDGAQLDFQGHLLSITGPQTVSVEDLPFTAKSDIEKFKYVTMLSIEEYNFIPESDYDGVVEILKLIDVICDKYKGITHFLNGDCLQNIENNPGKFSIKQPVDISLISLEYFYENKLTKNTLSKFFSLLESFFPESKIKKYGEYEPASYDYNLKNRDHFYKLILEGEANVIIASSPIVDISINQPEFVGATEFGYRCNTITISFNFNIVKSDIKFIGRINDFFKKSSVLIDCFYSDIRILHNYSLLGNTLLLNQNSDRSPVDSWWWQGMPRDLGNTCIVGKPYLELWPGFKKLLQNYQEVIIF